MKAKNPASPMWMIRVVMPPDKRLCDASLKKLDKTTLPGSIKANNEWSGHINDKRLIENPTRSLIGRAHQVSGVTVSCWQLPRNEASRKQVNGKVLLDLKNEVAAPDPDEVDEEEHMKMEESFLAQNTKLHNGWKVSYRKGRVEQVAVKKVQTTTTILLLRGCRTSRLKIFSLFVFWVGCCHAFVFSYFLTPAQNKFRNTNNFQNQMLSNK